MASRRSSHRAGPSEGPWPRRSDLLGHPDSGPPEDWHDALFYRSDDEYVEGVLTFIDAASSDEPVFIAVPSAHSERLRSNLFGRAGAVHFADMAVVGRNPGRIIPAIRRFVDEHRGRRVSFVGEPIWPGRSPAEIAEATRHEALINTAFAGGDAAVLCPYDVSGLDASVLADAARTHPHIVDGGHRRPSRAFADPFDVWRTVAELHPPPDDAVSIPIQRGGLARLRRRVCEFADAAGLAADRTDDLLMAVSEVATNTLVHAPTPGSLVIWREPDAIVCQVIDHGLIDDPMTGRRLPRLDAPGGRGLWLVNHLCDLVQIHSDNLRTVVRLHVSSRVPSMTG